MWKVYQITTKDEMVYIGVTSMKLEARMTKHKFDRPEMFSKIREVSILLETESYDEAADLEELTILKLDATNPEKGYNRRLGDCRRGFPKEVLKKMSDSVIASGKSKGENNGMFGRTHTEEARQKIREATLARDPSTFEKNKIKTPQQIQKMRDGQMKYLAEGNHPMKGKIHSDEAKAKISAKMKGHKRWQGKKHSEESKRKISESRKRMFQERKSQGSTPLLRPNMPFGNRP